MASQSSIGNYDYECTRKCHLPHHGNAITAALTKKSVSDELLAAYVAKFCRNFAEILDDQVGSMQLGVLDLSNVKDYIGSREEVPSI